MVNSRNCIKVIAPFINKDIYNLELLTIILKLLHNDERETNIIAGIKLLGDIYKGFEKECIKNFLAKDILCLV